MKITEILKQIKPYVLGWIEDFGNGGVSNKEVTDALGTWWGGIILLKQNAAASFYPPDDAGLALAIAASTSGDSIWMPSGVWTADVTLPTGVAMAAMTNHTIFSGQITLGDYASLKGITVNRSANNSSALTGVTANAANACWLNDCSIVVIQAGSGTAKALDVTGAGIAWLWGSDLRATSAGLGYGVYQGAGSVYVSDDGYISGSTQDFYGAATLFDFSDEIKVFDSAGADTKIYPATAAGLTAALAAMSAGDKFEIPQVTITLAANLTIPAGVMGWGMSRTGTVIDVAGYTITMGDGAYLANMRIETEENTSSDLIAVKNSATGESMLEMIDIYVNNAGSGDGIGVSAENAQSRGEGTITIKDCYLYANSDGGDGYAGVSSAGVIYVYHSRVYGSTDRFIIL